MKARSLSPTEARVVLSLEAEGVEDLTLDSLRRRARVSEGHARQLAHTLLRKGWLQRTGRGRYLLNPSRNGPEARTDTDPLRLGRRIAPRYYFGYATAAELQGLLPQAGRVYYVVSPDRGGVPKEWAGRYRRVRIPLARFYGTRTVHRRGEELVVSDPERTLLDCLERPGLAGGLGGVVQILDSLGPRMRWDRLDRYVRRRAVAALRQRLGYLVEHELRSARPPRGWLARLRPPSGAPYVPLGAPRTFGRRGQRDSDWRVIVNLSAPQLRAEVDLR